MNMFKLVQTCMKLFKTCQNLSEFCLITKLLNKYQIWSRAKQMSKLVLNLFDILLVLFILQSSFHCKTYVFYFPTAYVLLAHNYQFLDLLSLAYVRKKEKMAWNCPCPYKGWLYNVFFLFSVIFFSNFIISVIETNVLINYLHQWYSMLHYNFWKAKKKV